MNPPHIQHFPPYTPVTPGMAPMVSASGPMKRTYAEANPQPQRIQHMSTVINTHQPVQGQLRYVQQPVPQYQPSYPTRNTTVVETPEAKRRRYNSTAGTYEYQRGVYPEQGYHVQGPMYVQRETMPPPRMPSQATHPQMRPQPMPKPQMTGPSLPHPTARTPYPPQYSQPQQQARQPPSDQSKHDATTNLPPLKTANAHPKPAASANAQTQKSGIEAMIMSYPVLTKLKTLSSITPMLATPGPASPPYEVRGAIIAVEGLDSTSVYSMTHSLAEQLEKEGKFAVRVFGGPDPYAALASSNRASIGGDGQLMTSERYLNIISEWHKISKEMVEYITTKPFLERDNQAKGTTTTSSEACRETQAGNAHPTEPKSPEKKRKLSPISAVSPKTIIQTADLSLDTPKRLNLDDTIVLSSPPKSRIPASARLAQQSSLHGGMPASSADGKSEASALPPPPPPPPPPQPSPPPAPPSSNTHTSSKPEHPKTSTGPSPIPIAVVPHYQLTTVDTSSIALPITDNYDPLTHWRWHATLWRGCVGPDVTVIIKSPHEQYEEDASGESSSNNNANPRPSNASAFQPLQQARQANQKLSSGNASTSGNSGTGSTVSQQTAPFGVEVRLQDYRAVVVRSASSAGLGSSVPSIFEDARDNNTSAVAGANENWEKAKRRVGFEVEEYLRK